MAPSKRKRVDRRCLPEKTRRAVVEKLQAHHSYQSIQLEHNVSCHTVRKIALSMGDAYVPNTLGNKRSIDERTERMYIRTLQSGGMNSIPEMQKRLQDAYGVLIKNTALRDMVKRHGFKFYSRKKRQLLTLSNKRQRLAWCEKYKHVTASEWEQAIFADETQVKLYEPKVHAGHWRLQGPQYASADFLPVQQSASGNMMVWGAISKDGPGPLCEIHGTMTAQSYKDILSKHLVPYYYALEAKYGDMTYIDDNDPKHNSTIVALFKESKGIGAIDFPPRSPDLNAIENVWSMLHGLVFKNVPLFTPRAQLFERVLAQWRSISADTLRNIIRTMPDRINRVIEAEGGNIPHY